MLEPALGPNSVLTLDDAPHMQQRKLLLPPFHGERMRGYGELIRETTCEEMETWPVGETFALRPHTQRITLAVIMRAVFGVHDEERLARFEGLIETSASGSALITAFPPCAATSARSAPGRASCAPARSSTSSSTRRSRLRRAEVEAGEEGHDDVLSLLL